METITFEKLPEAVSQLFNKLDQIERVLLLMKGQEAPAQQPDLMNVGEAADFLDLTVPTIYSKTSKGELPFMKRSKRLYFSRAELTSYLKQCRTTTSIEMSSRPEDFLKTPRRRRA